MITHDDRVAAPRVNAKQGRIVATPTTESLAQLFKLCQMEAEMGVVTGEPGVGKTSAACRYVAGAEEAYLVTMSPATSALVPCLARIGASVGAFVNSGGAGAWSEAIRGHLHWAASPKVILIDEAHHLADVSVEEVRAIFDATNIGVVFIGSPEIRERWTGRRWAQFTSRVFQWINLEAPAHGDVDAIGAAVGVEERRSRDLLRRAARRPGGLREVRKILNGAALLAGDGAPIGAEHIEALCKNRGVIQ